MILIESDLKVKSEYISGIKFSREAIRKYKYTITSETSDFFQDIIYAEVHTKKVKGGEWGKGDVIYYYNDNKEEFKDIKEALRFKYELQ